MHIPHLIIVVFFSSLFSNSFASQNCTTESTACDPRPSCCSLGEFCNFNRGIPVCQDPKYPVMSGFSSTRCGNPYLADCSRMGTEGLCCPIGTICYTNGVDSHVSCVDAYGTFSPAISSTDQGFLPPANAVANGDAEVEFDPPEAWIPASTQGCAISTDARSTDVVNASISFNFTGPSIRIHTIKSPQGGVFSMVVDGVPLNDTIDTFNADGELCFPIQFPPFMEPPPGYGSRNEHSITLFHHGPSTKAPNDTTSSNVVFDSFAIPQFDNSESSMTNSDDMTHSSDRRSAILAAVFILLSVLY